MKKIFTKVAFLFGCVICMGCANVKIPNAPDYSREDGNHFGELATINLDKVEQTIDGFGASDCWILQMVGANWPEAKRNQIADYLFSMDTDDKGNPKGIGLSIWRFNIGTGSADQGSDSGIPSEWKRSECFLRQDGTYDMTKQSGQRWFLQAAKARGVERFLMFSISPPVSMTANGYAFPLTSGTHLNLKSGKMGAFADFFVESIDRLQKQENIKFWWLSPLNEPQWPWNADFGSASQEGTPATNEEAAELIKLLSSKLKAKGLKTEVVFGEAGSIDYLYGNGNVNGNQIANLWSTTSHLSINNLPNVSKTISGHSYWTVWPISAQVSARENLARELAKVPGLKYWQTEYCILERPDPNVVPGGSGNGRDLGMETALFVSRIIHNDLVIANASSWQWWEAVERADYKSGLVYLDDGASNGGWQENYCRNDGYVRDSKLLWCLGNYSRFIRPGMKRVDVKWKSDLAAAEDAMISAWVDQGSKKIVIVVINTMASPKKITFDFDSRHVRGELTPYVTSGQYNLTKLSTVDASKVTVPPFSVVTFVGAYK